MIPPFRYKRDHGILDARGSQIIQLLHNNCSKAFLDKAGKMLADQLNQEQRDKQYPGKPQ